MKSYGRTDKGIQRDKNEDAIFYSDKPVGKLPNLYIIADGMGGHKAGAFASEYAVKEFIEFVKMSHKDNPTEIIEEGIQCINQLVHEKSEQEAYYKMGTTFVVATVTEEELYIGNIGDSRLYIIENNAINKITKDHSLVEEMIHTGHITEEEANEHPDRNVITRAIGAQPSIEVDIYKIKLKANNKILMCSDGLTNMLSEETVNQIINEANEDKDKVDHLINKANELGGTDNISVILMDF
ncbi:protein phosphatase [Natranaerovirga hydrolytica]|uniref:Protein phosphatase n=1 Tax=Natranaerovirga hydrolytica TaxID=680378 RepID=A0A4R1N6R5_9FIRM|nr:Stp1/IreP family PP2C-type Ser/Thr phosphatase [Natranaerovirga hydrolytica]TCK98333.1 protein phosphatase [Natranaerovirga hydrolytica]